MFVEIFFEVNNTHIREKPTQRLGRCFTEFFAFFSIQIPAKQFAQIIVGYV